MSDATHPQHHIDRLLARGRRRRPHPAQDEDDDELTRQERVGTESQDLGGPDDYA